MLTTDEQSEALHLIEQKRKADKALLEAGVKPKLRLVKDGQENGGFSTAFEKALEEYKAISPCPKCNNKIPSWGGPYCDCSFGQSQLAIHQRQAEAMKSRELAWHAERRKKLVEKLQKAGGFVVPEKYTGFTPKTLHDTYGIEVYRRKELAIKSVQAWADGKSEKPGLLLSGEFGTGKSALCFWAAKRRMGQTGEVPLLIRYRQFVDIVQDCYRKDSKNRKLDFISGAQQAEILMLDDFGHINLSIGEEASPDKQEIMLEVLDWRTQNMLPTLIVTNLTQAQLMAQFNGAITGRLKELCQWVEMGGMDLRQKGTVGW